MTRVMVDDISESESQRFLRIKIICFYFSTDSVGKKRVADLVFTVMGLLVFVCTKK